MFPSCSWRTISEDLCYASKCANGDVGNLQYTATDRSTLSGNSGSFSAYFFITMHRFLVKRQVQCFTLRGLRSYLHQLGKLRSFIPWCNCLVQADLKATFLKNSHTLKMIWFNITSCSGSPSPLRPWGREDINSDVPRNSSLTRRCQSWVGLDGALRTLHSKNSVLTLSVFSLTFQDGKDIKMWLWIFMWEKEFLPSSLTMQRFSELLQGFRDRLSSTNSGNIYHHISVFRILSTSYSSKEESGQKDLMSRLRFDIVTPSWSWAIEKNRGQIPTRPSVLLTRKMNAQENRPSQTHICQWKLKKMPLSRLVHPHAHRQKNQSAVSILFW